MPSWPWSRERGVSYQRRGGTPPSDHEMLDVSPDGSFRLWRSVVRDTSPPVIGAFAGALEAAERQALELAVRACRSASAVDLAPPAGAAVEKVDVAGRRSTWAEDASPPEPWGTLAVRLRALVTSLTRHPVAAVALEHDATTARLRHIGVEPLELDLSQGVTVRAIRWVDALPAGEWRAPAEGPGSVSAAAGWSFELPFAHEHGPAEVITAGVDGVLAFDGQFWLACSLESPAPPA